MDDIKNNTIDNIIDEILENVQAKIKILSIIKIVKNTEELAQAIKIQGTSEEEILIDLENSMRCIIMLETKKEEYIFHFETPQDAVNKLYQINKSAIIMSILKEILIDHNMF